MPGILVSLLLLEKYGSLVRFLRGQRAFDPFVGTIPDEYFFIVLSMGTVGSVILWRWDTIFPDKRDFQNLVHLPISLSRIFLGNLAAIGFFALLLAVVTNFASCILFPVAVFESGGVSRDFFRFAWGHAVTIFAASVFMALGIFAVLGALMAVLPYNVFRRASLVAKFLIALALLSFAQHAPAADPQHLAQLLPARPPGRLGRLSNMRTRRLKITLVTPAPPRSGSESRKAAQ